MDKKVKKKLEVARQKVQKLEQQLAGAKSQNDEPGEVERLTSEISKLREQIAEWKAS